jgi:hypothetical protein
MSFQSPFDQPEYRSKPKAKKKKKKKRAAKKVVRKKPARKKAKKRAPAKKKAKKAKKAKAPAKKMTARQRAAHSKPRREEFVGAPTPKKNEKCAWCKKKLRPEDPVICARRTCAPGAKRCKSKHPIFKHRCLERQGHLWGHGYHTDDTLGGRVPWELSVAEARRARS